MESSRILIFFGLFLGISYAELSLDVKGNVKQELPGLGTVIGETYHYERDEYPVINKDIDVFRGIPFAEPPVGQYRFAKPVPAVPFDEEYNATYFRKSCPQLGTEDAIDWSEDCLHLNIWAPNPRIPNAAVMVWIHGGAFILGDGVGVNDDGVPLVAFNEVVYVSIQYRLNSFGFLATGDPELPGNYGMWDQLLAMEWVKTHISAFGGNPDNIMIFGLSAGGGSVGLHLLAPQSWDSFNTAIIESGTGTSPWVVETDMEKARNDAISLGDECGCDTTSSAALLQCLRELPMHNITTATNNIVVRTLVNVIPFVPVVDNDFLPDNPRRLVEAGNFKQCNILLGTTKDEGTLFAMRAFPEQIPRRNPSIPRSRWDTAKADYIYSYTNDLIMDAVDQQYLDWMAADDPDANYIWNFVDMNTDEAFACPTNEYARAWFHTGNDVYLYQFNHIPSNQDGIPTWQGVAHGSEAQFVFGIALNPLASITQTPEEINMTMYMMEAWTNFAKTGNPNGESLPYTDMDTTWTPFTIPELSYKELSPTMSNKIGLKADSCNFWNHLVPRMVTQSADLAEAERQWREEFYSYKYEDMPEWQRAFDEYQELLKPTKQEL